MEAKIKPTVLKALTGSSEQRELASQQAPLVPQQHFVNLVESINGIVWEADLQSLVLTSVSRRIVSVLGYPLEECLGSPDFLGRILVPADVQKIRAWIEIKHIPQQTDLNFEHTISTIEGQSVGFRTSVHFEVDQNGMLRVAHGLSVNMTLHKPNENEMMRSLQELRDVRLALDEIATVAITDANGRITYVNDKFCQMSKYSREELLGSNPRILKSGHHPREFYSLLWETIGLGKIWRGEILDKAKDGTLFWVDTVIVPFVDSRGIPYQYVSFRTDITAKKRAEEDRQQFLQTRIELSKSQTATLARDQFMSVAAHELKTPLTSLQLQVEMVQKEISNISSVFNPHRLGVLLRNSLLQIKRMAAMINDMLDVARISAGKLLIEPRMMNLDNLVNELVSRFSEDLHASGCDVSIRSEGPVTGNWDQSRLEQVVINLLTNAMKYGSGKPIEIRLGESPSMGWLEVVDQGIGISDEFQKHLFQRFERADITKGYKGIGLGLWISEQIIAAHGGRICVYSQVGRGSRFRFELPKT